MITKVPELPKYDPNDPRYKTITIRDLNIQFQSGNVMTRNLLPEDTFVECDEQGMMTITLAINGEKFYANPMFVECWGIVERSARVKNPDYVVPTAEA